MAASDDYKALMAELNLVSNAFLWSQLRRAKIGEMFLRWRPTEEVFVSRGILNARDKDANSIWHWQDRQWVKIRQARSAASAERQGRPLKRRPDHKHAHDDISAGTEGQIVARVVLGGEKRTVVAERFGVSRSTVDHIVLRHLAE